MLNLAILMTAILFGGMMLYSFGFAAFLSTALPPDVAGPTIRRAFPARPQRRRRCSGLPIRLQQGCWH